MYMFRLHITFIYIVTRQVVFKEEVDDFTYQWKQQTIKFYVIRKIREKKLCFTEGIKNCKWHWTFYFTCIWIIRAKYRKKESSVLNFFLKFKIYWCLRVGCFISEHFDILTSQLASIALLISWTFIIQINIIAWSYTIKRWYL